MSFHVPNPYRVKNGPLRSSERNGNNGAFIFSSVIPSHTIITIASDGSSWEIEGLPGTPWEHVSVHCEQGRREKTPTWSEMCQVKNMFWDEEDLVIQFHPKKSEYVNLHPNTLHLWKPVGQEIPTPPSITIGFKNVEEIIEMKKKGLI